MAGKLSQGIGAALRLFREPKDFPSAIRLSDAMASSRLMQRSYARMLEGLSPGEVAHLRELTLQPVDPPALLALPEGSFGHEYARFIERAGLDLDAYAGVFPPYRQTWDEHWPLRRFAKVHDMHHFLLGFPLDFQSEIGLQAFNLRNFGEPHSLLSLGAVPLVLAKYGEARRTLALLRRGWTLAGQARNLYTAPLEDLFPLALGEVRARLRLPEQS
jgi:ubiquinone biosynthesis protein Coq4